MNMAKPAKDLLIALAAAGSLVLWSCASKPQPRDDLHPSGSEIERALGTKLPTFARVSKLSVVSVLPAEAAQNTGANVTWQARIKATIAVTTDTFTLDNDESNAEVTFVQPVKSSGESIEIFGKVVSELDAGAWRTTFELEGEPFETLGQPLSAFGSKKVIARGSEDERQYVTAKQNAEVRNAKIRILEGRISDYVCGHACRLTITDKKGKKHTEYCDATLCDSWWTRVGGYMPPRYKGKRVRITVVKKIVAFDVEGDEGSVMDVFTKIKFL